MTQTIFPDFEPLSRRFKRLTGSKVHTQKLFYFCGLKRSGLHAVSFWLLGHQANHAFINKKPAKQAGDGSPMVRTIQTSPLPLRLRVGDPVRICRDDQEQAFPLASEVDLLLILFQSQCLQHLQAHEPLVAGVEAKDVRRILLLRDPFNWAASYMKKSQDPNDVNIWPGLWKMYAKEFLGITNYLPGKVSINYNRWFVDQAYRQQISTQLGLAFTDQTLNVVSHHAGGSSFDQTNFDRGAQQMAVAERWKDFSENPSYVKAFQQHLDIVELAEHIFDFSPELAEFAASLRRQPLC